MAVCKEVKSQAADLKFVLYKLKHNAIIAYNRNAIMCYCQNARPSIFDLRTQILCCKGFRMFKLNSN